MKTIPSVRRGKPEENEQPDYSVLNIGGVSVYAHKSLEEYGALEIDLDSPFFGSDKLVLRGLPQASKGCCG